MERHQQGSALGAGRRFAPLGVALVALCDYGQEREYHTWEFDGSTWTQTETGTSPSTHRAASMVYAAAQERVLLFDGFETWEYDGAEWTQRSPAVAPPGRHFHAMVYDLSRERAVLFGGDHWSSEATDPTNDTWEWDGTTWMQILAEAAPPARSGHGMVYDPRRRRVVLFGGTSFEFGTLNDTWEYDGVTWTRRDVAMAPSPRGNHVMAYDGRRGSVVLFGGYGSSATDWSINGDTWEYDGHQWWPLITDREACWDHPGGLAYDPVQGSVLLFRGNAVAGDYPTLRELVWE